MALEWIASPRACTKCGVIGKRYYYVSDGDYDDERNKCEACGATWWVEGADY